MAEGRLQTNGMWTKIPDQLADDLNMGLITLEEYGLLIYMLQRADKKTGILVTNSGSLVSQINKDRAWVHNRLTALRKKKRIQSLDKTKPVLNQSRGRRKPYPVTFPDHLPMNEKTSRKPVVNQSLTSDPQKQGGNLTSEISGDIDQSQPQQGPGAVGTDVAIERDLDLEGDREKTTTEEVVVDSPSAGDEEPEPYPNTDNDATVVEGAILAKYRAQIMDRPPSPNALRDALEAYRVDQLTEAIDRMPDVLRDVKDGNGALGLACKTAKNPTWWRKGEGVSSSATTGMTEQRRVEVKKEIEAMETNMEEIKKYMKANPECKHTAENNLYLEQEGGRVRSRRQALEAAS